jgi:hypothetical protein
MSMIFGRSPASSVPGAAVWGESLAEQPTIDAKRPRVATEKQNLE